MAHALAPLGTAPAGGDPFRRNASLLWFGQMVSATGDALFLPCLGWLAHESTGRPLAVGVVLAAFALPALFFGTRAGALVDRGRRKRILVASDLLRAALLLAFTCAVWQGVQLSAPLLFAVAFLLGAFTTPFVPARDALLPRLIGRRSLPRWNAAFQTSSHAAGIVGLLLGGALLAAPGQGVDVERRVLLVLLFDAATFLVSAGALSMMRLGPGVDGPLVREAQGAGVRAGGWAEVRDDGIVRGLLVLTALNNLALMGPAIVGSVLLVQQELGGGPERLAWFEGAMAGGMLVGGVFLARYGRRWPTVTVLFVGLMLDGLTYLPFVWLSSYTWALVAIFVHGWFIPPVVVGRTTLLQRHVPDARRGSVFALVHVTVTGMTALSCLLAGAVASLWGVRVLFAATGVLATLSGIVGWVVLGPRLGPLARPSQDES